MYDPTFYRAYPGPRDSLLDAYLNTLRNEAQGRAVKGFLEDYVSDNQLISAIVATRRFEADGDLTQPLSDYVAAIHRAGVLPLLNDSILVALASCFRESPLSLSYVAKLRPDDFEFEFAAVRALMTWGRFEEAENHLKSLESGKDQFEYRYLVGSLNFRRGLYESALEDIEGFHPAEPEATLLGAACAFSLGGRAIREKMLMELVTVPRSYVKRFESLFRLSLRQKRLGSMLRCMFEFSKWLPRWTEPRNLLISELKSRTAILTEQVDS